MLSKIFGNRKYCNDISAAPPPSAAGRSRTLKIVHAGGQTEKHYMAMPASRIMEKNPSFILARPEIFRRPWDSIVRPDEILVPGHKYYLVPQRTVKKLRRRVRRTAAPEHMSFSKLAESQQKNNSMSSISGILVKPGPKVRARNLHVRFFGIESNGQKPGSVLCGNKSGKISKEKAVVKPEKDERKSRARIEYSWEPSLVSITE